MSINNSDSHYKSKWNSDFADTLEKALEKSQNLENWENEKKRKKKVKKFPNKRKIEKNTREESVEKGSSFTTDDIMRTLNEANQWQWVVKEIFDDWINLFIGNKKYFIPKVYFDEEVASDLNIGDSVAFELWWNKILTLMKNASEKKSKIENLNKNILRDGVHKWVISHYQDKDKGHSDRWYYVKIGKVWWEQDELFLPLKDMKTSWVAKVGDLISLKIKDTPKTTEVEEFYLKPWDEFILKSNNYKYISKKGKDPFVFVDMGVYKWIIRGDMLPKWFKKWDDLDAKVRFINKEKAESARDGLRGKWLVFEDVRKIFVEKNKTNKNNVKKETFSKKKPKIKQTKTKQKSVV